MYAIAFDMVITDLKDWFKKSVRDIRAFRVEDWSDFTTLIKED
jgi:virulence-associated protein VapD